MKRIQNFINGRFVDGTGDLFENRFPATGEVQSLVSAAGEQDVDAAVSAAKRALRGPWARLSVQERIALLRRQRDDIDSAVEELTRFIETVKKVEAKQKAG